MHNRLKQFLVAENVTQAQFATTIGIGKANISHVLSGRNKPGYDFIKSIMVGYPHLNINWLLLGVGKMYDMSQPQKEKSAPDGTIPFDNSDLSVFDEPVEEVNSAPGYTYEETEIPAPLESTHLNFVPTTSSNDSTEQVQSTARQRKVRKIVVLFDDGSFQEM